MLQRKLIRAASFLLNVVGMGAIFLLLSVITSSLVITRIGTSALVLTGMSREAAKFQSRSAFMGVGFTTSESESVVSHPVRRRIIMLLMLMGNVGIASVVATMILTVSDVNNAQSSRFLKLVWFGAGLGLLYMVSKNPWLSQQFSSMVEWALAKWTHLEVTDYVAVLQFSKGYSVFELNVGSDHWMGGQSLEKLALSREGMIVLGIQRSDGTYLGTPTGSTTIGVNDVLTLYGRQDQLADLNSRRGGVAGAYAHVRATREHRRALAEQQDVEASTLVLPTAQDDSDVTGISLEDDLLREVGQIQQSLFDEEKDDITLDDAAPASHA